METLLIIAVVLITLAVLVQAGILVGMYLMARKVKNGVDGLVVEGHRMMPPLESVAANLKTTSDDLVVIGKSAREQMHRMEGLVGEAKDVVLTELDHLRGRVNETVDEVRESVMAPVHQWSAITRGIAAGVRTFFSGRQRPEQQEQPAQPDITTRIEGEKYPAA